MPSKQTQIEDSICRLGAGEFQKFCDAFLCKKMPDAKIIGLGMKAGTLKTTIGNPDTYFRKNNGRYIFVAYTTQQDQIYSKLKEDIEKYLGINTLAQLPLVKGTTKRTKKVKRARE